MYINTYMESRKNGVEEPICREGTEMQTERTDLWGQPEGEGDTNCQSSTDIYTLPRVNR